MAAMGFRVPVHFSRRYWGSRFAHQRIMQETPHRHAKESTRDSSSDPTSGQRTNYSGHMSRVKRRRASGFGCRGPR